METYRYNGAQNSTREVRKPKLATKRGIEAGIGSDLYRPDFEIMPNPAVSDRPTAKDSYFDELDTAGSATPSSQTVVWSERVEWQSGWTC